MMGVAGKDAAVASAAPQSARTTVLVVEDDAEVRAVLRNGLEEDGFSVVEAEDRTSVFAALAAEAIDIITLDLTLGADDGLVLAREIRAVRNVPIIMITGRSEPFDRVTGLEHGADDYITKPFHIRMKRMLQRYDREALAGAGAANDTAGRDERYIFDGRVLDVARRQLTSCSGAFIDLTDTEFRLLTILVRHPGRILSRDEICRELTGRDWSPLDRTFDSHVARLRRKIEPVGEAPTLIKSVRGVGYVFAGQVKRS